MADSFFVPLGDDRWLATVHTTGPWDERAQHGGPPSALLGRAMQRCDPRDDMVVARFTSEILSSIPVGEVEVRARVARPGRSVQLLEAVLTAGGREVTWARTSTSPTGMDDRISVVNLATTMSSRGSQRCMARPSSALGGPPCWARSSHGPVVCTVASHRSPPRGTKKLSAATPRMLPAGTADVAGRGRRPAAPRWPVRPLAR